MTKYCVDCVHIKDEYKVIQNQGMKVMLCNHPDFLDPVSKEPLPANFVRKEVDFCSLKGKGWTAKPKEKEESAGNVIQIENWESRTK